MKKILIAIAAAGLMPLAACTGATNDIAPDNAAETNESNADAYQGAADDMANAVVANQAAAADAAETNTGEALENAH